MRSGKHYKKIKTPDGRDMNYHRYIMELHLGRRLSRYELVHHIDEDINNNDISNLKVMSLAEHTKLHISGNRFTAKLTTEQVIEIKRKFLDGFRVKELCKEYDVMSSTISLIISLRVSKNIDEDGLNDKLIAYKLKHSKKDKPCTA
jgi:hypothetical protein